MTARMAHAYGMVQALMGSVTIVILGLVLEQMTFGVTRQPLPLVWPLAVLHVVVAQLPLREILGPIERVAVRGPAVRGARAVLVLVLLTTGSVTYVSDNGNRALLVFFLALAAAGFTASAASRADPWVWTLGLGMFAVGILFVTPLGEPLSRYLAAIPVPVAATILGLAAGVYAFQGVATPVPRLHRRSA